MRLFTFVKNKNYLLTISLLLLLVLSGIAFPIFLQSQKQNFDELLDEKTFSAENEIRNVFNDYLTTLLNRKNNFVKEFKSNFNSNDEKKMFSAWADEFKKDFSVQIYNPAGEMIFWFPDEIICDENKGNIKKKYGQAVFHTNKLVTYLTVRDTINTNSGPFDFVIGLPVEWIKNTNWYGRTKNLTELLSEKLNTSVSINFSDYAELVKDGRKYSFGILNNFNNKIGVASFDKPALDNVIYEIENSFKLIQFFLIILIYLSVAWIVYTKIKLKSNSIKFSALAAFVIILRIILFLSAFPTALVNSELTDASNFSSTFAFGIVRSPLEFFITAVLGLWLVIIGFKYYLSYRDSTSNIKSGWPKFILVMPVLMFLILLVIRGLGASLRSVVFDSSIRYFKEFDLIPEAPVFLMDLNILVVGFAAFLFCVLLLMIVLSLYPKQNESGRNIFFVSIFALMQFFGILFDALQKQPQGTPLIRILFITLIFIVAFVLDFKKYRGAIKYLYIALGASIATVSLLTFYNSELEREALKTTAHNLTRTDEDIYNFMIFQTLSSIQSESYIPAKFNGGDLSSLAYFEWTKSLLYYETIPAAISFYNKEKVKVGGFATTEFDKSLPPLTEIVIDGNMPVMDAYHNIFNGDIIITGSAAISKGDSVAGYVSVSVLYDNSHFNFYDRPQIIAYEKSDVLQSINIERLKLFYFENGSLKKTFGAVQLSDDNVNQITSLDYSNHNEAWLKLNLSGENYLFYLMNMSGDKSKILAVAKEEKNFSWRLSDFFKVFFVHTIIILAVYFAAALWNFKKLKIFLRSYKTKLNAAFVVVSVIPLIIVAVYFKSITEEKNSEFIVNRITEAAEQLEKYLQVYYSNSAAKPEFIFEKAHEDLNVSFTVFKGKHFVFSTEPDYYNAGLLPDIIPVSAWYDLNFSGFKKSFFKSDGREQNYYAVYLTPDLPGDRMIIEVNSVFNTTALTLSDMNVVIFMFGVFSLAIILLIIFSSILAEQIFAPIRRLTNATRSLGGGDLNIEVTGDYSGEIAELTGGFNMMVKRLRKNQMEMAMLERESAWKEMAKQVAHEIKNPLTPMKLSVQQLIAAHKDKSEKFDSIFEKVTSTIVAQIEALKNIASEFSNFARMPKLSIKKINLADCVPEVLNLFSNEKMNINFTGEKNAVWVEADQDHFNRTLINLIRNSIQASAKNIRIDMATDAEKVLIRVMDDGAGIENGSVEKIFDENFTTKHGGMGLGLSMAKKFLESINGNISVEKTSVNGTVFLITIPIAQ